MPNEPHDEFLELCALSTSGQLTKEEQKRLREHLAGCPACREVLREYQTVVGNVIPAIAANDQNENVDPGPGWSQKKAETVFFKRLSQEEFHRSAEIRSSKVLSKEQTHAISAHGPTWFQIWLAYAAGVIFLISAGLYVYRVHLHTSAEPSKTDTITQFNSTTALEQELSDVGHQRAMAQAEIAQRDKEIAELRQQLTKQSANIAQMRFEQERLGTEKRAAETGKEELAQKERDLEAKLELSESNSHTLQEKINILLEQSLRDKNNAQLLQAKNADLTRLLEQRQAELRQQDQLLAHDKDIRDLMGARDLYVAEVYDIARTGEKEKAYGRVFYTRGKSLIFYAYDLEQDADVNKASIFQAWGRRGADRQMALNLGIFYVDNIARKRWILKCEDPKTLAQIDGVFVTVEPSGGSEKPSGKSLLSAYLKVNPNHP